MRIRVLCAIQYLSVACRRDSDFEILLTTHKMASTKNPIVAYPSAINVLPGDRINFMVHSPVAAKADATLVRIGTRPGAGTVDAVTVPSASFNGPIQVGPQLMHCGNHCLARLDSRGEGRVLDLASFSLGCAVFPTRPAQSRSQTIFGFGDSESGNSIWLELDARGRPQLVDGNNTVLANLQRPLVSRRWALLGASLDASTGRIELFAMQSGQGPAEKDKFDSISLTAKSLPRIQADAMALAARSRTFTRAASFTNHFDGKIEAPRLFSAALPSDTVFEAIVESVPDNKFSNNVVGWWDLSIGIGTADMTDLGPLEWHGKLVNLPMRGVKGIHWNGETQRWSDIPAHYAAIQFNSDAQYDMEWTPSVEWEIPNDLPSGAYAARFTLNQSTAYAVFFVEPPQDQCHPVVFLAPTLSYLAYANEVVHIGLMKSLNLPNPPPPSPHVEPLQAYPELGRSLYERYADISGIRTSSYLRPITNLSLDARPWAFPADVAILQWLSKEAPGYSVVTDHGLHWRGVDALKGARVVVTGSHPEYYSRQMLDSLEAFLAEGGRLMYMGGNGFYWVTNLSRHFPGAVELRRAEDGTRAWIEEPGEYYHCFTSELGGMWRRNDRAPNRLVGIGFAAQGFDKSTYYRRKPGASDPRASFIFKGVPEEIIGDFGTIGGGAAGEEIDRYDRSLGSPAHALILASSENHGPEMLRVKEEFYSTRPLLADPYVRADMTFFETPSGGAVFSTGSIAWAGALGHEGYENNVARISTNVLRRFADPEPFAYPGDEEEDQRAAKL